MISKPLTYDRVLLDGPDTGADTSLTSFLEKPYLIQTGLFQSTDTAGTFPAFQIPRALLTNDVYKKKIDGFMSFRADIILKLQINGTRFQQGKYILYWVPSGGGEISVQGRNDYFNSHSFTLTQVTQLPHVIIDVNNQTEATLNIPFLSAYPYFSVGTLSVPDIQWTSLGTVNIRPYSATTSTLSYSLWASFKNVKLKGPVVPQSGGNATELEQSNAGVRPISDTLRTVSKISGALSAIPTLSAFAAPISWVSNSLAGAAQTMGWSKPLNVATYDRMIVSKLPYMHNIDTADQSFTLSYMSSNQVEVLPGFSGTDHDELDFSYFFSKPCFIKSYTFSTSNAVGDILNDYQIGPAMLYNNSIIATKSVINYAPAGFVLTQFNLYRGSFKIDLHLVKTEFHSGRLLFAFFPRDSNGYFPVTPTLANSQFVHREIVDIRDTNFISLEIPWISNLPYKCTTGVDTQIGNLIVFVLDPLVAPPTVSGSITLLSEHSMSPDTEVAVPKNFNFIPIIPAAPQSGAAIGTLAEVTNIGGATTNNDKMNYARACIGEHVCSFRSILKQARPLYTSYKVINTSAFSMYPFGTTYMYYADLGANSPPAILPDLYGMLSSIFAFSRGGARIKVVMKSVTSQTNIQTSLYADGTTYTNAPYMFTTSATPPVTGLCDGNLTFYTDYDNAGGVEVQCPQYANTAMRANLDHSFWGGGKTNNLYNSTLLRHVLYVNFGSQQNYFKLYRSGADDCNFGLFVSIPPVVLATPFVADQVP